MSYQISTLIEDCQRELNIIDETIDEGDYLLFANNANEYFRTTFKLPTTESQADLVLYRWVQEYALPSDWLSIIEPKRPSAFHSPRFTHGTEKALSMWPFGNNTAIKWDRETPILVATIDDGQSTLIQACDSLTDAGTWAISGDGGSLVIDQQVKVEGEGSLRFVVTASGGTTTLTCTGVSQFDVTDYIDEGRLFLNLQCPSTNTTALTSVRVRIGNDASNYYEATATTRHNGSAINGGWGLISLDYANVTATGTVTDDEMDYIQILITHGVTGIAGTYRLDQIFLSIGTYFFLPYYSRYNIKTASSTYQEKATATTDTIMAPGEFDIAIRYKVCELAASQRLQNATLANKFTNELVPKEFALAANYPRQNSLIQTVRYKRIGRI
jgi:hypothetical protein